MEIRVRRPKAGRPGRRAFVSGKRRQNTIRATTISDGQGRTSWYGATRPGRMHDQSAMRTEGIAEQFRQHPIGTRDRRLRRRLPHPSPLDTGPAQHQRTR
ncbi:transposase family protein [Streptomyces sp. 7R007]